MTARLRDGQLDWRLSRDDNGYRTYKLKLLVEVSTKLDGPAVASNCPGLPLPGSFYLVDNDADIWVWCRSEATITPVISNEPNQFFIAEFTYSNKPLTRDQAERRRGCHELQVDDPLLEPDRTSGTFTKKAKEATHDRFGNPILNSAHEVIRGPQIEFDESRPNVKVVQNRALLEFPVLVQLIDGLNDAPLWSFPARWVKFSNCSWEQQFYGQCYQYFTRTLDFEIREDWDRDILDEGSKVLNGHWGDGGEEGSTWVLDDIGGEDPNPADPSHFIRAVDRQGNPMRVILDGEGKPATRAAIEITNLVTSGGVTTVTTERSHGLTAGDEFELVGVDPPYYDGQHTAASASGTTITFAEPITGAGAWVRGGHVYVAGSGPGNIHVEKFRSVNLLRLGIPLILGP